MVNLNITFAKTAIHRQIATKLTLVKSIGAIHHGKAKAVCVFNKGFQSQFPDLGAPSQRSQRIVPYLPLPTLTKVRERREPDLGEITQSGGVYWGIMQKSSLF